MSDECDYVCIMNVLCTTEAGVTCRFGRNELYIISLIINQICIIGQQ